MRTLRHILLTGGIALGTLALVPAAQAGRVHIGGGVVFGGHSGDSIWQVGIGTGGVGIGVAIGAPAPVVVHRPVVVEPVPVVVHHPVVVHRPVVVAPAPVIVHHPVVVHRPVVVAPAPVIVHRPAPVVCYSVPRPQVVTVGYGYHHGYHRDYRGHGRRH